MKESSFRFSNPIIKKLNYEINPDYKLEEGRANVTTQFTVNVKRDKEEKKAVVDLNIIINNTEETNQSPFHINIILSAQFIWTDVYDEKTLKDLLSINAPALLLGYARPMIASITSMSPYPSFNLPFYNFVE